MDNVNSIHETRSECCLDQLFKKYYHEQKQPGNQRISGCVM